MSEHATARHYGGLLGILSGLFALLQVMISASSVKANELTVEGLQSAFNNTVGGVPTNPLNLLADLVPVLVITYLSAAVAGVIMMGFAWYAGRLTALAIGRREFGGVTGFWVALWSGGIWLALSLIVTLFTHADGTISGLLTSSPGTSRLGTQVILLLLQNSFAALCGLGLGAIAGLIGARGAPVTPRAVYRPPLPPSYPSGYPIGPLNGPPLGYGMPQGSGAPWPGAYPPGQWNRPSSDPPAQGGRESPPQNAVTPG